MSKTVDVVFPNMYFLWKITISFIIFGTVLENIGATIDLNPSELQYLADHLTPVECRSLIASLHCDNYEQPNSVDQSERKVPRDLSCIQLLHQWNSNEGKGQSFEILGHRLRQMEKYELADYLGSTVFHSLGEDLNKSLEAGVENLTCTICTTETIVIGPTLAAAVETDEMQWSTMDTILYAVIIGLSVTIIGLCLRGCCMVCSNWIKRGRKRRKLHHQGTYDVLDTPTSGSESEDKFDIRDYSNR